MPTPPWLAPPPLFQGNAAEWALRWAHDRLNLTEFVHYIYTGGVEGRESFRELDVYNALILRPHTVHYHLSLEAEGWKCVDVSAQQALTDPVKTLKVARSQTAATPLEHSELIIH